MTGGVDGNPLKVRATFDLASTCSRYDINWGDNSTHSTQSEGSCGSGVVSKDVTHTYSSAGTYTITLKRGAQLEFIDTAVATIVQ